MQQLIEFVNRYVMGERNTWRKARTQGRPAEIGKASAGLFEAFLWLHAGVEVGSFPEAPAFAVFQGYFSEYFQWLDPTRFEGRQLLSASSIALDAIYSRFPSVGPLLNAALSNRNPFVFAQSGFSRNAGLASAFNVLTLQLTAFARNSYAQLLSTALNFMPDTEYYELVNKVLHLQTSRPEGGRKFLAKESNPRYVYKGYLAIISHVAASRNFFSGIQAYPPLEQDAIRLLRAFREYHRWRLDLRGESVAKRFTELHKFFRGLIVARAGPEVPDEFLPMPNFDDLWQFWSPLTFGANTGGH